MQTHQSGRHLATTLLVLAMLSLGCDDSTGPRTGAIAVWVWTVGDTIDRDHDGYALSVDGGPPHALSINASLRIANISPGNHLVRLDGLAANCSVSGTNPRTAELLANYVDVVFLVSCVANTGSMHVSTATSGSEMDPMVMS